MIIFELATEHAPPLKYVQPEIVAAQFEQREKNILITPHDKLVPLLFHDKNNKWIEGYWDGHDKIRAYSGIDIFSLDEIDIVIIL